MPVLCAPRRCAKTCHPSGDIPSTWHSHHAGDEVIRHHAGISHHAGECHHAGDSVLRYHAGISHRAGECHHASDEVSRYHTGISHHAGECHHAGDRESGYQAAFSHLAGECSTQVTKDVDTTQVSLTSCGQCHHAGAHPVSFIIRKKPQQLFAVQPRHRQGMKPFLRLIIVAKQFVSLITRRYQSPDPACASAQKNRGKAVAVEFEP